MKASGQSPPSPDRDSKQASFVEALRLRSLRFDFDCCTDAGESAPDFAGQGVPLLRGTRPHPFSSGISRAKIAGRIRSANKPGQDALVLRDRAPPLAGFVPAVLDEILET